MRTMVTIHHDILLFIFCFNLILFIAGSFVTAESTERLTIKINPSSAVVEEGDRVNLTCEFSKPTTCSWERNGGILMTNPDKGPGDPSKNSSFCSYNFASISKADFGVWRCFSHGTSILQPVFSNSVVITSKKTLQWNIAAAKKEQSESLSCFFGGHTDCIWRSSESATKPFVNPTYNQSLNFTECTLRIASVKKNDIVTWECSNNYLESTQIKLSTELPTNTSSTNNTTLHNDNETSYGSFLPIIIAVGVTIGAVAVCSIIVYIVMRVSKITKELNDMKAASSAANAQTCQQMTSRLGTMEHAYIDLTDDDDGDNFSQGTSGYLMPIQVGPSISKKDKPLPLVPMSALEIEDNPNKKQNKVKHFYNKINHTYENA